MQSAVPFDATAASMRGSRPKAIRGPAIAAALTSKHHWLVIACDNCDKIIDLDLTVKLPRCVDDVRCRAATVRSGELTDWSKKNHYRNSHGGREHAKYGQTAPEAGHASHRKSNSYPQTSPQRRPAHPRVPDRGRGRTADESRHEKPLGPPGRHHDPGGLPTRPAGVRASGPALGSDRVQNGYRCTSAGSSRALQALIRS